jgi:hypothetical protein
MTDNIVIATDTAEDTEIPMRILRIATCPSLSGRSELTYHVGCNRETNAISFRLWENSSSGMFSNTWFSLKDVSCQRRLNIDPPCRSNIDPGRVAGF